MTALEQHQHRDRITKAIAAYHAAARAAFDAGMSLTVNVTEMRFNQRDGGVRLFPAIEVVARVGG